jgi:transcriptional regulator with XRE-family HTH domain
MSYNFLRNERIRLGWTQAKLAKMLGVSTKTVVRWELGKAIPYPYNRKLLSTLFGKTTQQLGLLRRCKQEDGPEVLRD